MIGMESERDRLLRLVADHVLEAGVSALTLRGAARAVGSNNRMLLYYFGSKEEMVAGALQAVAQDRFPSFQDAWAPLEDPGLTLRTALHQVWETISAPVNLPFLRLFFEVFGLAGAGRGDYSLLLGDIGVWHRPLAARLHRDGVPAARAEVLAMELVAVWRGLQMMLVADSTAAVHEVADGASDAFCRRVPVCQAR